MRKKAFLERAHTMREVVDQIAEDLGRRYRLTPIYDVRPPRIVQIAVEPRDYSARSRVLVAADDRADLSSPGASAELRHRIDLAIRTLKRAS